MLLFHMRRRRKVTKATHKRCNDNALTLVRNFLYTPHFVVHWPPQEAGREAMHVNDQLPLTWVINSLPLCNGHVLVVIEYIEFRV